MSAPTDPTYERVQRDLAERARIGRATYGRDLTASTDKDLLWYAYEEALDLCLYLRAEIDRRDHERRV